MVLDIVTCLQCTLQILNTTVFHSTLCIRHLHQIDLFLLRLLRPGFEMLSEVFLYFKSNKQFFLLYWPLGWHVASFGSDTTVCCFGCSVGSATAVWNLCLLATMCRILYKLPPSVSSLLTGQQWVPTLSECISVRRVSQGRQWDVSGLVAPGCDDLHDGLLQQKTGCWCCA